MILNVHQTPGNKTFFKSTYPQDSAQLIAGLLGGAFGNLT